MINVTAALNMIEADRQEMEAIWKVMQKMEKICESYSLAALAEDSLTADALANEIGEMNQDVRCKLRTCYERRNALTMSLAGAKQAG